VTTNDRRIRDLTSQQPYQELQHVLRQKELVEAENADIKKRLASVLSMIQPVLVQPSSNGQESPPPYMQELLILLAVLDPVFSSPSQPYIPNHRPGSSSNANGSTPNSISSPNTGNNNSTSWGPAPTTMMGEGSYTTSRAFHQQRYDLANGLNIGPERLGLDFLLDTTQHINKIPNGIEASDFYHSQMKPESGGSMQHHLAQRQSSAGSTPRIDYSMDNVMAAHTAPVRNCAPTCPLDNILLDFLHERQQQAASGMETPKLVGPAYPSVSSLLNPSHASHPLSKVFTDILGTFPDLSTLPEKVAVLYIMFLVMRWQISPTQENYDRLPDWATPRPSQLFTPHPAWIDHLPFPRMRDKLVRDHERSEYLFDNFFIPFTSTLSLNWPYEPTDTLLASGDSEELMINPVFERHMRRLDNWSLGAAFEKSFPGLVDTYRVKIEGDRRS
jgi:hypothetical protein